MCQLTWPTLFAEICYYERGGITLYLQGYVELTIQSSSKTFILFACDRIVGTGKIISRLIYENPMTNHREVGGKLGMERLETIKGYALSVWTVFLNSPGHFYSWECSSLLLDLMDPRDTKVWGQMSSELKPAASKHIFLVLLASSPFLWSPWLN